MSGYSIHLITLSPLNMRNVYRDVLKNMDKDISYQTAFQKRRKSLRICMHVKTLATSICICIFGLGFRVYRQSIQTTLVGIWTPLLDCYKLTKKQRMA